MIKSLARNSLKRENIILEAVFNKLQTSLAYLDSGLKFIKVNEAFKQGFSCSMDLKGRYFFDVFPDSEMEAIFNRVKETGETAKVRAKAFKYNTKALWDWSLVAIPDDQGSCQGLILELTDVTERILINQGFEESLVQIKMMNYELNIARVGAERRAAELAATFRAMGEAVIIYDNGGNIVQVNSVTQAIFGFDPTGITRRAMIARASLRFTDGLPIRVEELPSSRALQGEKVYSEYLLITNNIGPNNTILVSAAPLIIDGKAAGVVTTCHDVTEREQLHRELEYEQTRLQIILEQMPSGVIIVQAPSGRLIMANEQATQILKIPLVLNESYGQLKKLKGVFCPNGQGLSMNEWPLVRTIVNGDVVRGEEIEILHDNGSSSVILMSSSPIWDREQQIMAAVSVFSDITDRKQGELVRQLQQIIEFLPDAIFVLDQDRKVIAWNRAIELLTDVTKAEIIGKGDYAYSVPFFGLPRPTLIDLCWENEVAAIAEDHPIELEGDTFYTEIFVPRLKQGKGLYLAIKATPLKDNQGRITGAIASIRDKTRQHEMEEQSFKAQKIESIGILAGGIAHDFNNFLAGILANVQLVKMKLTKGLDVSKSLDSIEETVSKAADLTRQLLTFSKGGAPIKKTMVLKDLLRDTAEFALRGSKSRCIYSIPDNLWPVQVDAGQISQVLSNLIINADQAMANGGLLWLKAENTSLLESDNITLPAGKYIKIKVSDQGIGIPKENLNKIFDPYFTTKTKGNGLGLTTSYAIICNHKGYIRVESQVDQGTSFYIYLPAVVDTTSNDLLEEKVCYRGDGRILIMDDEDVIRIAAGEMLSEIGYQVDYARNGNEAIQIYRAGLNTGNPFDAVIMDLTIPGGRGGKDTLTELFKYDPEVKAIVSSGYSNDPIMSNYQEYGFCGVAAKPYKIEELSLILQRVIKKYNPA